MTLAGNTSLTLAGNTSVTLAGSTSVTLAGLIFGPHASIFAQCISLLISIQQLKLRKERGTRRSLPGLKRQGCVLTSCGQAGRAQKWPVKEWRKNDDLLSARQSYRGHRGKIREEMRLWEFKQKRQPCTYIQDIGDDTNGSVLGQCPTECHMAPAIMLYVFFQRWKGRYKKEYWVICAHTHWFLEHLFLAHARASGLIGTCSRCSVTVKRWNSACATTTALPTPKHRQIARPRH